MNLFDLMWGRVYPEIVYGFEIKKYPKNFYEIESKYYIIYEWVQKNLNCGKKMLGIPMKDFNDIPTSEKISEFLEKYKNKKYLKWGINYDSLGIHFGVLGYDAENEWDDNLTTESEESDIE